MLPPGATEDAFAAVCQDEAALRPGVERLCRRLGVNVPGLARFAAGEHDGWGYVLMSRLPGVALDTVWDRVSVRDRDVLASQLGETVAVLHRLPPPEIPGWRPADWPAFVAAGCSACPSRPGPR